MLRPAKYKKLLKRTFARNGLTRSLTRLAIRRTARELGLWDARVEENLIVSLTSFPARIEKVHLVVQSLLNQSLQPRKVVLYLSRHEFPDNSVPRRLARLESGRFEIRFVQENLQSHNKLIFALVDFPGAWIATFDDDRLYPAHTLARLWQAATANQSTIVCTGGRRMVVHDGHLANYREWPMVLSPEPTFWVLPLGGYGVLYPPGSLNSSVGDRDLIRALAPLNDDIWFKAMSLTRDVPCRAIGGTHLMPEFKFRGSTTLSQLNQDGRGQDAALGQVFEHFGLTVLFSPRKRGYIPSQGQGHSASLVWTCTAEKRLSSPPCSRAKLRAGLSMRVLTIPAWFQR